MSDARPSSREPASPNGPTDEPDASLPEKRAALERYDFRSLHPGLKMGTATDRYGGWLGKIYSERWKDQVSTKKRTLRGKSYEERQLPVASVAEYFAHFSVLELDFTFYRPLLDEEGQPTSSLYALERYARHAPAYAQFLVKAPQAYTARKVRRSGEFTANSSFLALDPYRSRFLDPLVDLLGERLAGVIFQQEYQRVAESPSPEENVERLDAFFAELPSRPGTHLELRSDHLLTPAYYDWLAERGLGYVFSHWTWLPRLKEQWERCGGRFTGEDDAVVARLLTPRNVRYAEAYDLAYPFEEPVPELAETDQAQAMIDDTTALAYRAIEHHRTLMIAANNRAYGCAPDLARAIGARFLDFADSSSASAT